MIAWILEPTCRRAVRITRSHTCFHLGRHEVSVYSAKGMYLLRVPRGLRLESGREIAHESHQVLLDEEGAERFEIFWSMYENGYDHFRKYEWSEDLITLGNQIDDDLYLQDASLSAHQFVIDRTHHLVIDRSGSNLAELDGAILTHQEYHNGSVLRFLNVQIVIQEHFLMVSQAENLYVSLPVWKRREEELPEASSHIPVVRTWRSFPHDLTYSCTLREPLPYHEHERNPLVFTMGPALMMSMASLSAGLINAYNGWLSGREWLTLIPSILLPSVMILSALLWNPLQRFTDKRRDRRKKQEREEDYHTYLAELEEEILAFEAKVKEDTEQLYRDPFGRKNVYASLANDPDYCSIPLGKGPVKASILFSENTRYQTNDPIPDWIEAVKDHTGTVEMPVVMRVKEHRRISVSYEPKMIPLLEYYLFSLLYRNGPDLVKLAVLADSSFEANHGWLREVPHTRLSGGVRLIASTMNEALELSLALHQSEVTDLVILSEKHALAEVFREFEAHIISLYENEPHPADSTLRISLYEGNCFADDGEYHPFEPQIPDAMEPWKLVHQLNCYELFGLSAGIPVSPSFFDLYGIREGNSLGIEERWNSSRSRDSLWAYIGTGDDGEPIMLDLHESGNGPHGLIAGMTGSGKSELMITLLLSLCVNYSPREFQFVMIDFKGGGAAQLFVNASYSIPHSAGILSNLDVSGMERALVSFQNECHRREHLFQAMSEAVSRPIMNLSSYQSAWEEEFHLPYLSSLLIIVDEFAELKKERPDFMRDLISLARVGRSLGMHMILATQKPSGIVDEQIWSNTRFKICLKVQEKQDSVEMIHAPDASWIIRPGEFCLLCDGMMTHGYGGYANAPSGPKTPSIRLLDALMHTKREVRFDSEPSCTQAYETIQEILSCSSGMRSAEPLWLDPLGAVTRNDLPEERAIWLGRLDDYYHRRQPAFVFTEQKLAVFSIDRTEKCRFLNTLLYGILETAEAWDEVFLIDDLSALPGFTSDCASFCGILSSSETEKVHNLFAHLEERTANDAGLVTLILTDLPSFYEAEESNRQRLHNLIEQAEKRRIRLILFFTSANSVSYRDLALIPTRIALKNASEQDLSGIFELPVHRTVTEPYTALIHKTHLIELAVMRIREEEVLQAEERCRNRLGTIHPWVIPSIPDHISYGDYRGEGIGLGIGLVSYQWAELGPKEKLIVLATYEEEMYGFFDLMKEISPDSLFHPEEAEVQAFLSGEEGGICFMSLEMYQLLGIRTGAASILYLGTGFRDQYRFTTSWKKDLKENHGVLYQRGRNQVIQVAERYER